MEKQMRKENGITLIVLVITIILLLILATVTIKTLFGNNGLITKAIEAKEKAEISNYYEKIELIRADLKTRNKDYESPTISQMKEELESDENKKWAKSTEIIMDNEKEKLKLITKEGYIFYITETGTEYKGKGKVVDTSDLEKEDVLKIEIIGDSQNGKIVKITDLTGKDYYTIKYQIENENEEWIEIQSGETVEVGFGKTIYAKLYYGPSSGVTYRLSIENSEPKVEAKNIDKSNIKRKTDMLLSDLFDITCGSDGVGTILYEVTGNLGYNNSIVNANNINNISQLELGNYNVKCQVTSPNNKVVSNEIYNIKITTLADTTLTDKNNSNANGYAIYSEYDLAYFRDLVNDGNSSINAKLMNDIELKDVSSVSAGGWKPIGYWDKTSDWTGKSFSGTFDGNSKKIKIISLSTSSVYKSSGLFGMIIEGMVKNLTFEGNLQIPESYGVDGVGIVGALKDGKIEECINNCTIKAQK